jgi:hypothetical protein
MFQTFFLASSSFQFFLKNAEKGKSFPSSSHSTLSFLGPTFALPLMPFYFKHFLLASSSSQAEEKKKNKEKKP